MVSIKDIGGAPGGLRDLFRSALEGLREAMPVALASISARPRHGGPLEVVSTLDFVEKPGEPAAPLAIGDAAVQWFEANRKELVLAIRPDHVQSDFYRPFTRHGLQSVLVVPVFRDDALIGTVAVGALEQNAYTKRHLKLVELMVSELAPGFPTPAPAAAPSEHAPHGEPTVEEHSVRVANGGPGASPDVATIEADAFGRIAHFNGLASELFGIPKDEAVGGMLTVFYSREDARRVDVAFMEKLLAKGLFRGRALGFDADGLPVLCDVEIAEIRTPTIARGFRGRFRRVSPEFPPTSVEFRFDFARAFPFTQPVR